MILYDSALCLAPTLCFLVHNETPSIFACVIELRCATKLHYTKMSSKVRENLWKWCRIERIGISIDRARCDESNDVSFNQKGYDFTTENRVFLLALCIFAGSDVIRERTEWNKFRKRSSCQGCGTLKSHDILRLSYNLDTEKNSKMVMELGYLTLS